MIIEKITDLDPKELWFYFNEICKYPHPSRNEVQLVEYLKKFCALHKFDNYIDEAGNIVIRAPGTKGMENAPSVALQAHLDMVPQKTSESTHDFAKDPIQTYIDNGFVKARGTTLGADDGIGIAAALAIITSDKVEHGPIEVVLTSNEEVGLCGVVEFKKGILKSKYLINLDSETEGEFFIGCAGGIYTNITIPFVKEKAPAESVAYKVLVTGLKGGHSGADIHLGRANANKVLNRLLLEASKKYQLSITNIVSGGLSNVIPREGYAEVVIPQQNEEAFLKFIDIFLQIVKNDFIVTDPNLSITAEKIETPCHIIDKNTQKNLLNAICACQNGVLTMSPFVPGLVESSTNLANINTEDGKIIIKTLQRSLSETLKNEAVSAIRSVFELIGGKAENSAGYPGWNPNVNSKLLAIAKEAYVETFGNEPSVKAIHAGLECGLFSEKYPEMDMLSIGPTMYDVHSPDERLDIESTKKFWKFLANMLPKIR